MTAKKTARAALTMLPTGVPGLDEILGGGVPEYSFNLIAGPVGSGKTTLAHQIMFALATTRRPAVYFTVVGEPPLKMLRYQQQIEFFDPAKLGKSIHFIDLSELVLHHDLTQVLAEIVRRVEEINPGVVIVDSFQTVVRSAEHGAEGAMNLRRFVQHLAIHLTTWQATTFLVGDYANFSTQHNPMFTVADGIIILAQDVDRNSSVRKLNVLKSRGQDTMPGLHTFRITQQGVQVFPRMTMSKREVKQAPRPERIQTGVAGLDALMGGGIPAGDAILVSGPSGTGKSVLATQFIATGARNGEPGVIAIFEEHPQEYLRRASELGFDLVELERTGAVKLLYLRPLDLSPDEALYAIREAVEQIGARRVVIDSMSGFEMALAPTFRQDFRESLYRLVGALTGTGVTVLVTMEIVQGFTDLRFSSYVISFLADNIILLRYVEIAGQLRRHLAVIKMRNSDHAKDLRLYEITGQGMIVQESLRDYLGVSSGMAELRDGAQVEPYPGLTNRETGVLRALLELGETTAEELMRRVGMPPSELSIALDRLVSLNYVIQVGTKRAALYRPVAQYVE